MYGKYAFADIKFYLKCVIAGRKQHNPHYVVDIAREKIAPAIFTIKIYLLIAKKSSIFYN